MYKTMLIGNVGQDAKVSQHEGKNIINFSVAVQIRKDVTQWVDCAYWRNGDQSVAVADYITKGKKVYVEGQCVPQVYDGKPQLKMTVTNLELVSSNEGNN